ACAPRRSHSAAAGPRAAPTPARGGRADRRRRLSRRRRGRLLRAAAERVPLILRAAVRVPAAERESAIATLLGVAETGFEEVEQGDLGGRPLYTDGAGPDRLRAVLGHVVTREVADGWEDAWRAFHRPVTAGGLWIGPPWLEAPPGAPTVVIDPGRAFGTGAHPTTRLCIELLAEVERGSLLDVGCGSGVISIAAARLRFAPITAVDVDPVAVEVTVANAAVNGVAVDARTLDATKGPLPRCDV